MCNTTNKTINDIDIPDNPMIMQKEREKHHGIIYEESAIVTEKNSLKETMLNLLSNLPDWDDLKKDDYMLMVSLRNYITNNMHDSEFHKTGNKHVPMISFNINGTEYVYNDLDRTLTFTRRYKIGNLNEKIRNKLRDQLTALIDILEEVNYYSPFREEFDKQVDEIENEINSFEGLEPRLLYLKISILKSRIQNILEQERKEELKEILIGYGYKNVADVDKLKDLFLKDIDE